MNVDLKAVASGKEILPLPLGEGRGEGGFPCPLPLPSSQPASGNFISKVCI